MFLSGLETVDKAQNTVGELACHLPSHPGCGHLEKPDGPPTPEDTAMVTEEQQLKAGGWYLVICRIMSLSATSCIKGPCKSD